MTAPGCWHDHPGIECTRTAPGGHCPPNRCYCGACPWADNARTHTPDYTAFDRRAVASGRRSSGAARRAAR